MKITKKAPTFRALIIVMIAFSNVAGCALLKPESSNEDKKVEQPSKRVSSSVSQRIEGDYTVRGKNPNGTEYEGKANITRTGENYKIEWKIGKQTFFGTGKFEDELLQVTWEQGLVTYVLKDGGMLDGSWANGLGTETLSPIGN